MAGFSSSPPPTLSSVNGFSKRRSMYDDDIDELTDDTIPRSPHVTQPTQPLERAPQQKDSVDLPSSPAARSIVEVPASSPYQAMSTVPQAKSVGKTDSAFASKLAPAGTSYRPPQQPTGPRGQKRPAEEPILIDSDEDNDRNLSRGEIRPTAFRKQIQTFAYIPVEELQRKIEQIQTVAGPIPTRQCREALEACHNNVQDAIDYLLSRQHLQGNSEKQNDDVKRPSTDTSKYFASDTAGKNKKLKIDPTKTSGFKPYQTPISSPQLSPVKAKPPRRRLVQGRRPRRSPSPDLDESTTKQPPEVIDVDELAQEHIVIPDDNDDDFNNSEDDVENAVQESLADKALKAINTLAIEELAAMTNLKTDELKTICNKRPFDNIAQVEKITVPKKSGSRKSSKKAIGETLVEGLMEFNRAANAIDTVVADCETKATRVKDEMTLWDLNEKGHKKSTQDKADTNAPLTPESLKGRKYTDPPIPRQPSLMDGHCEMRPFQLFGLNWMNLLYQNGYGCILADEMGLGKTCQVISLVAHLVESYDSRSGATERPWPNLVVVPPSTLSNWEAEFERFAPDLSVQVYQGSQTDRQEIAEDILNAPEEVHVVLTSYSQLGKEEDIDSLIELKPNMAIFDEGHQMKNPNTKKYKSLVKIKANWRMLLTGTPVQNNLKEMLSLLNFIDPKMFKGHMEQLEFMFGQKVTLRDVNNGAFLYGERVTRARTILEPFILQRRKQQVLSDMPDKVCNVVHCDLISSQKDIYEDYERKFKSGPVKLSSNARQNDQNNVWIQLRKAAIHPQLFRRHFTDKRVEKMAHVLMDVVGQTELQQPHIRHLIGELKNCSDFELHLWCRDYPCIREFDVPEASWMESGKVAKMLELIHQYEKNGDRVLVFSKFAKVVEILREVLFTEGIRHSVLYGATSVEDRQDLINEFNGNKDITAFLLTTGAGGTGINLTAANKVIIFDQSDNPQDDIQAENRAHRLGQERDVEVIRLLTSNTIEELIYKACSKKIELANKVTGAIEDVSEKVAEENLEKEVRKMMADQMTPS